MAIRKKGARLITVGDTHYRWHLRKKASDEQRLGEKTLSIAIQRADRRGSVLVVRLPHTHPDCWLGMPGSAVLPSDAARCIRLALDAGWKPKEPGKTFRLDLRADWNGPPREFGTFPYQTCNAH